jgi:hypothetical protein
MIYLHAACAGELGANRASGEELGNRMTSLNFVEVYQKMWKKHFGSHLFQAETISETLLYNLMVSLEVSARDKSQFAQQLRCGLPRNRSSQIVCQNFCIKN